MKGKRLQTALTIIAFLGIFIIYFSFDYLIDTYVESSRIKDIISTIGWVIIFLLGVYSYLNIIDLFSNRYEVGFNKKDYIVDLKNSLSFNPAIPEQSSIVLSLMIDNMAEIREYFTISKSHVKKSFFFLVLSAIAGLVIFICAIVIGFVQNQLQPAIIASIAAGTIEIISAFSLHMYKDAQKQLNHYYKALHENEKYLTVVNLVGKLSENKRDEAYLSIINSTLSKLYESKECD